MGWARISMKRLSAGHEHLRLGMIADSGERLLASLGTILVIFLLLLFHGGAAAAREARTALVIGNGAYSYGALPNPVNDATDVAAALHDAGFEVTFKKDADRTAMVEAIHAFADTLRTKGGVGLFYFSGHGLQAESANSCRSDRSRAASRICGIWRSTPARSLTT